MITKEQLNSIANLARLNIEPEKTEKFAGQVSAILSYIDILKELNVDGIVPTAHAVQIENVFRDESLSPQNVVADVLKQAPVADSEFFKVPKVL